MSTAAAAARRLRGVSPRRVLGTPGRLALAVPVQLRRRLLVLAAIAALLFAAYMLVLRDVGLVAVEKVEVTGLTGKDAGRAGSALEQAAKRSTTLHVNRGAIDAAAARFPTIDSVRVQTDFPKGMRITVIERRPAAMVLAGSHRIPVAADGSILTGLPIKQALPVVKVERGELPTRRLTPSGTLDAVRVAGGAPAALTPLLTSVTKRAGKGWVAQVKDGPALIIGPASRLGEKWAAIARVLADGDAAGADYIDVRIPDRPAAGGLPVQTVEPVAPAGGEQAGSPGAAPQQGIPDAAQPTAPTSPQVAPQTAPQAGAPDATSRATQP